MVAHTGSCSSPGGLAVVAAQTTRDIVFGDLAGCIEIVRGAYLAHAAGQTVNPKSVFLTFPDKPAARIIALPAHISGPSPVSGVKWISSYPDNIAEGLGRASAVLLLNECVHGRVFACLEASTISAARTAASAALAAQALWQRPDKVIRCLGVIGAGVISRTILQFLWGAGWQIERYSVSDLDARHATEFGTWLLEHGAEAAHVTVTDTAEAVRSSDLILLATTAAKPHIDNPSWFAHHPLVLHISLRDLAPRLLIDFDNIVDDPAHVFAANTALHLAEQHSGHRDYLTGTLADFLQRTYARSASRTTVFSPFGLGILDIAVGAWVYDRAQQAGQVTRIEGFF